MTDKKNGGIRLTPSESEVLAGWVFLPRFVAQGEKEIEAWAGMLKKLRAGGYKPQPQVAEVVAPPEG